MAKQRAGPIRRRWRLTEARLFPVSAAIRHCGQRWRRSHSQRCLPSGGMAWGQRRGRELRSVRPASPSSRKRASHLNPVRSLTPQPRWHPALSSPARSPVSPTGLDLWPSISHAYGCSSVLLKWGLPSRQHQLRRSEMDEQPTETSQLGVNRFPYPACGS